MAERLEKQLVIYESPFTQITSLEQASLEVAFLKKAFSLGMFNKIYYKSSGGGFLQDVNSDEDIKWTINQIIDDAQRGKLPSKYSVGMNVFYDGEKINTNLSKK